MKKVKPIFEGAEPLAEFFYICAVSTGLMYILCKPHFPVCMPIMTAFAFGVYMLFYSLRRNRLLSFLAFAGLFVVVNLVMDATGALGTIGFMRFIFTASSSFNIMYASAAILFFGSIIGFIACYFSALLPRPGLLILPAFIPLILSARSADGLPIGLLAFIVVGYIFAAACVARNEAPAEHIYFYDKSAKNQRLIALFAAGIAAVLLLSVIPLNDSTPMGQYFDDMLTRHRNSVNNDQMLSDFEQRSHPNTGKNRPSKNTLFFAVTEAPKNVSRWSYDTYLGEDGWTYNNDFSVGYSDRWDNYRTLNYTSLIYSLKNGVENGKLEKYRELLNSLPNVPNSSSFAKMSVHIVDGSNTSVVLHPSATFEVNITGSQERVFCNGKDEVWTREPLGINPAYTLNYYTDAPNSEFIKIAEQVDFKQLLSDAADEGVIEANTAKVFSDAFDYAEDYYTNTLDNSITPRIQALADEITAGIGSNYEKALAVEKWFGTAGFVYDTDFVPEETTAEYFMFESKRGICTDFATASTLLLRAAGIPARYTEGFALKESSKDEYGKYVITPENAHAYSTAYITGYGWLEIDGTRYSEVIGNFNPVKATIEIIIGGVILIIVLIMVFRTRLSELWFRIRFAFSDSGGKIRLVYLRTRDIASGICGAEPESLAAEEVCRVISQTPELSAEAGEIVFAADALFYSGEKPKISSRKLIADYKKIRKANQSAANNSKREYRK